MDRRAYKEKLIDFNNSEKYIREMDFMEKVMDIIPNELVLDFGAGLGTMSERLRIRTGGKVYAYDIHGEYYQGDPFYFKTTLHFYLDKIYFMHSVAHLEDPLDSIIMLRDKFLKNDGKMYFCTPNQEWIDKNKKPDYKPDPTAIKHFTRESMLDLLIRAEASEVEEFIPKVSDGLDNERLYFMAKFNPLI